MASLIFGGAAAAFVGTKIWIQTETGRLVMDNVTLRMPVFGPLFKKVAVSRFARTFATLIQSGVPILGALEIVAEELL